MTRDPTTTRVERAGTAPSGASDIGLYGAMPIAFGAPALAMTLGGTPAEAAASPLPGASSPGSTTGNAMLGEGGSPMVAALMAPVMLAEAATAALATLDVPRPAAPDDAEPVAKATDAHGGSGTPTGILTPNPVSPTEAAGAAATDTADDGAVIGAIAAPAGLAPSADLQGLVQSAIAGAETAMAGIGERIDAIDAELDDIGAELGDDLAGIDALVGEQLTAVDTQVAAIGQGVAATIGALPDIELGPVGGIDPAGGVATLVSMVSAADMFGLPDIGGGDPITLPALGLDGGDMLADFAPADVLLTIPDHHDGALGLLAGLTDDHFG